MKTFSVCIDIGGTNTILGFVDKEGNIFHEKIFKTRNYPTADDLISDLSSYIKQIQFAGESNLIGIGVGAPNGNYYNGTIEYAPNLNWEGVIDVVKLFNKYIDTKVLLTNDANAAAIGEKVFGDANDCNDFIVITLGTGVGSGFFIDGKLLYGHTGFAGEFGHTIAIPDGRMCGCNRKGCLETYTSARGVVTTFLEIAKNETFPSKLLYLPENRLNSELIYKAAMEGDEIALKAFDYTAKILGEKLGDAVAITSPERIYLFGGLARSGDLLLLPLKKYFEDSLLEIFKNKVDIRISGLLNKNAAVLGASSLIWDNYTE
jgi:glucokinase